MPRRSRKPCVECDVLYLCGALGRWITSHSTVGAEGGRCRAWARCPGGGCRRECVGQRLAAHEVLVGQPRGLHWAVTELGLGDVLLGRPGTGRGDREPRAVRAVE